MDGSCGVIDRMNSAGVRQNFSLSARGITFIAEQASAAYYGVWLGSIAHHECTIDFRMIETALFGE
jgi:hypothetical protein